MNYLVLVEGRVVEKAVYTEWIPYINKSLSCVNHIGELTENSFCIISGHGYPYYLNIIESAIQDIKSMDASVSLIICVDSEEMTKDEKYSEIEAFVIEHGGADLDYNIVVQHFCFETWVLGNRRLSTPARNVELVALKKCYDVTKFDPEGLRAIPEYKLNRSQLAEMYLRLLLNNKHKNLSYSKSNPAAVKHYKYFEQIRLRLFETGHISSFSAFIDAFQR